MDTKESFAYFIERSKIGALISLFYSGIGHILIFHRVCPDKESKRSIWCKGIEVTPAYLERVVKYFIDRKYDIISLDQLVGVLQRKRNDKRYVVFTFDDGYADNFTYAYPVFKKYNIPFTIYVTTGFIDRQANMWWYSLSDLLFNNDHISFELDNKAFDFDCPTNAAKERAYLSIEALIKNCKGAEHLNRLNNNIFSPFKIDPYRKTNELALTWEQIRKLNEDPLVTIGAHTVNHLLLNRLSQTTVKEEMLGSKIRLESQLTREIKHFAYPNGGRAEVSKREFELAKESGFVTAVTTRSANIFSAHYNHLECLPRFDMAEEVDFQKLQFLTSGITHCIRNRFKRVITI